MTIYRMLKRIMNKDKNNRQSLQIDDSGKVIIYESELIYLSKCILESPQIETGGNLFGLWTPFGIPLIHYVVGPGPNAVHNFTHFRQDFEFLDKNAGCLVKEHALHHIGSWHSHHSLGLSEPSGGDTESTLSGMRECNLASFILLIGNYRYGKSMVNAFRYYSNGGCVKLKWVVLKGNSPFRTMYDKLHPNLVYAPQGQPNMMPLEEGRLIEDKHSIVPGIPVFESDYWLSTPENRKELAVILKFLRTEFESVGIFQIDSSTVEIRMKDSTESYKFVFDSTFPKEAPTLLALKGRKIKYQSTPEWKTEGLSISEAFIHYFKTIRL